MGQIKDSLWWYDAPGGRELFEKIWIDDAQIIPEAEWRKEYSVTWDSLDDIFSGTKKKNTKEWEDRKSVV